MTAKLFPSSQKKTRNNKFMCIAHGIKNPTNRWDFFKHKSADGLLFQCGTADVKCGNYFLLNLFLRTGHM